MNRRVFLNTTILAAAGSVVHSATAAEKGMGKIGKMDPAEFTKTNVDAAAKVAAIKPTMDPLSKADEKLMMEVAMGGMMQLAVSQVAVKMATSPDVMAIAQAEVDEQTGLSAKLMEIATAKKVTLPTEPDEKTKKMVTMLEGKTGAAFDKAYLEGSGVKGHEALNATMKKVESKASDETLKTLAMTALPLIKVHLKVSEDEISDMA